MGNRAGGGARSGGGGSARQPWSNDPKVLNRVFRGLSAEQKAAATALVNGGFNQVDAKNWTKKYYDTAKSVVGSNNPKRIANQISSFAAGYDPGNRIA